MKIRFWERETDRGDDGPGALFWFLVGSLVLGVLVFLRGKRESGQYSQGVQRFVSGKTERPASRRQPNREVDDTETKQPKPRGQQEGERKPRKADQSKIEDLEVVEGIGPKTASILRDAGITTFRQLAQTPVERLEEILDQAGLCINPPDTWPEQARLAADGNWEGLEDLKKRLHAGRRDKQRDSE